MLSYLLLNNELESAVLLGSKKSFQTQLMKAFDAGDRNSFFQVLGVLTPNSKLEFYLHVYFLIYEIHPHFGNRTSIPEPALKFFKAYIDSKGGELAKTSEFLEFYALPYIPSPKEHQTFATLFKKEWVDNLRGKLSAFVEQEKSRMRGEVEEFQSANRITQRESQRDIENRYEFGGEGDLGKDELYRRMEEYVEKYKSLEEEYRSVIGITNSNMIESQSKWFQIVKELVQCSRSLINLVTKHNKQLTSQRKFLNIRKKIDRFQKFVSQNLQDMISQSQDISVFDRPSMNEISCTIAATQKSYSNNFPDLNPLTIEQYIPTDFKKAIESLNKEPTNSIKNKNISIIQGLIFRIIKSKDPFIRRQHIIGILQNDVLGVQSKQIKTHLGGYLCEHLLLLLSYIESDFYGRNTLFTIPLVRQLILILKNQDSNLRILEYIVSIFQQLSAKENIKLELINQDIIKFYLNLFRTRMEDLNESIIEQISGTLLNLTSRSQGILKYQAEPELFQTFGLLLESQNTIVRVITNGIVYNLLGSRKIYDNAFEVRLDEVVEYLIETDKTGNLRELKYIESRLKTFVPSEFSKKDLIDTEDRDEIFDEDYQIEYDDDVVNIEAYIRSHEFLLQEFSLPERQQKEQTDQTRNILDTTLRRSKQRKSLEQIENFSKKFKAPQQSKIQAQPNIPLAQSFLSPREKEDKNAESQFRRKSGHRHSDRARFENNSSLPLEANYTSLVVQPVTNPISNFSPSNNIKPREHIVNKLNNQIKAQKQSLIRGGEERDEKKRHLSFNQNKQQSSLVIPHTSRHSKDYEGTDQYKKAFGAKPRLNRSPPRSPR